MCMFLYLCIKCIEKYEDICVNTHTHRITQSHMQSEAIQMGIIRIGMRDNQIGVQKIAFELETVSRDANLLTH